MDKLLTSFNNVLVQLTAMLQAHAPAVAKATIQVIHWNCMFYFVSEALGILVCLILIILGTIHAVILFRQNGFDDDTGVMTLLTLISFVGMCVLWGFTFPNLLGVIDGRYYLVYMALQKAGLM